MITVFTPAYNRASLLPRLYESLKAQSSKNFEWIIVDDGSTDNTASVVEGFKRLPNGFEIIYYQQENKGKHVAINKGVELASGDLFFIVDSDDFLSSDAIASILLKWEDITDNETFDGLVFNRSYHNGAAIGEPRYKIIDATPLEFRFKHRESGDKAEIIKTSVFKKLPFPENGEKFCTEAYFFYKIGKLRFINQNIYFCEYLPGGLSDNSYKTRKNSPINACTFYSDLARSPILNMGQRFRAAINYYRFLRFTNARIPKPFSSGLPNFFAKLASQFYYILIDRKNA